MYWKKQDNYSYLVKTMPDNRQKRIGPRSPETDAIYEDFMARKAETEARKYGADHLFRAHLQVNTCNNLRLKRSRPAFSVILSQQ
jgi:hypothetical protein